MNLLDEFIISLFTQLYNNICASIFPALLISLLVMCTILQFILTINDVYNIGREGGHITVIFFHNVILPPPSPEQDDKKVTY